MNINENLLRMKEFFKMSKGCRIGFLDLRFWRKMHEYYSKYRCESEYYDYQDEKDIYHKSKVTHSIYDEYERVIENNIINIIIKTYYVYIEKKSYKNFYYAFRVNKELILSGFLYDYEIKDDFRLCNGFCHETNFIIYKIFEDLKNIFFKKEVYESLDSYLIPDLNKICISYL